MSCNEEGCYVVNSETGERKNKKRIPKKRASAYMRALYHAEGGGEFDKKESEEMMEEFINDFVLSGLDISGKEKPMKSEQDGEHPSSHYLVVEDPQKPTTWHLRVRNSDGSISHSLMGGAWAALTSPGGHRGNKYQGPNKAQALSKLRKLYSSENMKPPGEKGEDPDLEPDRLMVYKEDSGEYRWIMFSSNAFRDRDGEIVSLKALTQDVERADREGDYGPLRWWHIGSPDPVAKSAGPGLDIGDCDFNAMHGKILIESGTFRDREIGEIIAGKSSDLQGSILFFHPASEPDDEGVFHNIYRAERSLLPRGKASNSLVSLLVNKKESEMEITKEKIKTFINLVGEGKMKEALKVAELTEKEAEEMGFSWKGDEPEEEIPETEAPDGEEPESIEEEIPGEKVPKEFQENIEITLKELLDPVGTQLKEVADSQVKILDSQASMKEVIDGQSAQLKSLEKRVKELEGEEPRSRKGYRPSQDDETIITDEHQLKGVKPGIDPEFMGWLAPGVQE